VRFCKKHFTPGVFFFTQKFSRFSFTTVWLYTLIYCFNTSTSAGLALSGESIHKGGAGSYSMPVDTPAAVITFPSSTMRSLQARAFQQLRRSSAAQCVVARRPLKNPAAPRTKLPVHTEVVQIVVAWISRTHCRNFGVVLQQCCPASRPG